MNIHSIKRAKGDLYVHLDPAIKKDGYALAGGHLELDEEGFPLIFIDILLLWEPQFHADVSFSDVGATIRQINSVSPINCVTADHFSSVETIQRLKEDGIRAEVVFFSNRQQLLMYDLLRQLLHENRIFINRDSLWSPTAIRELKQVQLINQQKIDHPKGEGYSKDLADAIAAVAYKLHQDTDLLTNNLQPNSTTLPRSSRLISTQVHPIMKGVQSRKSWIRSSLNDSKDRPHLNF